MIVYEAIVFLWLGSEVIIGVTTIRRGGSRREDRLSGPVLVFGVALSVWLGVLLAKRVPGADIAAGRDIAFALGAVIAVAGIALRWWAVVTLGRFFTTRVMTTADQTVVEKGPYRLIRHPSYTGGLVTILGVLLMSLNWISLACFVIALPGFAYRIRVEERALVAGLGGPYSDYMRRTKRLVPYLV
jgi:protein-S-isoprenylcysteine O-methyltransferase Ste14